jgi:hypothetical protein
VGDHLDGMARATIFDDSGEWCATRLAPTLWNNIHGESCSVDFQAITLAGKREVGRLVNRDVSKGNI